MWLWECQFLYSGISLHFGFMLHLLKSVNYVDDLNEVAEALVHDGLEEHDVVVLQDEHEYLVRGLLDHFD